MAPKNIIEVGDGFWNLRSPFKIRGLVDIKTHASLIRRASGSYLLLDACDLDAEQVRWIDQQTTNGAEIEAILHLHPFHGVFVRPVHERYPRAKLYGTSRHQSRLSDLPWEKPLTESPELHDLFAADLDFSVPRGVDLVPARPNLHFSSVLAFHRASRTLHVDDTLCYTRLPKPLAALKPDVLMFHPSLAKVLQPRAGAAQEFRDWAAELVRRARDLDNLCTAHTHTWLGRDDHSASLASRIDDAVRGLDRRLRAHKRSHG